MDVRDKLKKYLNDNGIHLKWFAEKIEMDPRAFYAMMEKRRPIPKRYWKSIILLTNKQITLNDLAEIHLDDEQDADNKKSKNS